MLTFKNDKLSELDLNPSFYTSLVWAYQGNLRKVLLSLQCTLLSYHLRVWDEETSGAIRVINSNRTRKQRLPLSLPKCDTCAWDVRLHWARTSSRVSPWWVWLLQNRAQKRIKSLCIGPKLDLLLWGLYLPKGFWNKFDWGFAFCNREQLL